MHAWLLETNRAFRRVMMQSVKIGFEALPIVPILSRYLFRADQDPQKMARPARIELAAPRLGGGCSIP